MMWFDDNYDGNEEPEPVCQRCEHPDPCICCVHCGERDHTCVVQMDGCSPDKVCDECATLAVNEGDAVISMIGI